MLRCEDKNKISGRVVCAVERKQTDYKHDLITILKSFQSHKLKEN